MRSGVGPLQHIAERFSYRIVPASYDVDVVQPVQYLKSRPLEGLGHISMFAQRHEKSNRLPSYVPP
jgi:hypothetical protein